MCREFERRLSVSHVLMCHEVTESSRLDCFQRRVAGIRGDSVRTSSMVLLVAYAFYYRNVFSPTIYHHIRHPRPRGPVLYPRTPSPVPLYPLYPLKSRTPWTHPVPLDPYPYPWTYCSSTRRCRADDHAASGAHADVVPGWRHVPRCRSLATDGDDLWHLVSFHAHVAKRARAARATRRLLRPHVSRLLRDGETGRARRARRASF